MVNAEHYVARLQAAGLIEEPQAAVIRAYEAAHARPQRHEWQVLPTLILGGILFGAGVLLFVAAHWDSVRRCRAWRWYS